MFLVLKGTLSIRKMKGATHIELAKIYANEVVGELSFFDRQPRSASAFALTEVEVAEVPFESLDKLFENTPPYLKSIISSMADRLRKADETIKRLQRQTAEHDSGEHALEDHQEFDAASVLAATGEELDDDSLSSELSSPELSETEESDEK